MGNIWFERYEKYLWQKVKVSSMVNRFTKAGVLKEEQKSLLVNDDDPFGEFQEWIEALDASALPLF